VGRYVCVGAAGAAASAWVLYTMQYVERLFRLGEAAADDRVLHFAVPFLSLLGFITAILWMAAVGTRDD
jgi:hypothetical protein